MKGPKSNYVRNFIAYLHHLSSRRPSDRDLTIVCSDGEVGGFSLIVGALSSVVRQYFAEKDPFQEPLLILPDVSTADMALFNAYLSAPKVEKVYSGKDLPRPMLVSKHCN